MSSPSPLTMTVSGTCAVTGTIGAYSTITISGIYTDFTWTGDILDVFFYVQDDNDSNTTETERNVIAQYLPGDPPNPTGTFTFIDVPVLTSSLNNTAKLQVYLRSSDGGVITRLFTSFRLNPIG